MEGLILFLMFAVFCYTMIRFISGSAHNSWSAWIQKNQNFQPTHDPVCGMKVDDEGYGKLHGGHLYRFCSKKCLDKFDGHPGKYIANTDKITELKQEDDHET